MKKISFYMFLLCCFSLSFSQSITEKQVVFPQSFGQKKFAKAPKKVYIANFKIYYQLFAYEKASNDPWGPSAIAEIGVHLDGLVGKDLKDLTNALYEEVVREFESKGFQLLTAQEAANAELYSNWELQEGGELNEDQLFGYYMSTPDNYSYFIKKEKKSGKQKGGEGIGWGRYAKLSDQLEDAVIMDIEMVVPFMNFQAKAKSMVITSSTKLKADPELQLANTGQGAGMVEGWIPITTHVSFVSGKAAGFSPDCALKMVLKKDVPAVNDIFPEEIFETKAKGIPALRNQSSTTTYTVTQSASHSISVDHEAYKKEVRALLTGFTGLALGKFFDYASK